MWVRCASTVRGETKSSSAICRLVSPCGHPLGDLALGGGERVEHRRSCGRGPVEDGRDERDRVGGQVVAVEPLLGARAAGTTS